MLVFGCEAFEATFNGVMEYYHPHVMDPHIATQVACWILQDLDNCMEFRSLAHEFFSLVPLALL